MITNENDAPYADPGDIILKVGPKPLLIHDETPFEYVIFDDGTAAQFQRPAKLDIGGYAELAQCNDGDLLIKPGYIYRRIDEPPPGCKDMIEKIKANHVRRERVVYELDRDNPVDLGNIIARTEQ